MLEMLLQGTSTSTSTSKEECGFFLSALVQLMCKQRVDYKCLLTINNQLTARDSLCINHSTGIFEIMHY
jgi:hypothetical protein